MANINIDTTAAGYQNRLTQYNEIMQFWKPNLIEFFKMDQEQRQAYREMDKRMSVKKKRFNAFRKVFGRMK
jgi:hypothetical protein